MRKDDLLTADEINEAMRYFHPHHYHWMDIEMHKKKKKKKRKKKTEIAALRKELDKVKEECVEFRRENFILKNKVHRLEHEEKMNQPRGKKHPGFYGAPFYCWGTDAWK